MSMPLNVLEVSPEVATEKLRSYRAAVKEQHRAEDRQLARGFAAIKRGRQVITLSDTIRGGGFDDKGRPKLAVVRATAKTCFLHVRNGEVSFSSLPHWRLQWGQRHSIRPTFSSRALIFPVPEAVYASQEYEAIVPSIPPEHRPRSGARLMNLDGFFLLWEAVWTTSRAPRDPALIRHLGGDLWAVWAVWTVWDLTSLESAVLVGA